MAEWLAGFLKHAFSSGSLLAYPMLLAGGLIASFTPCTYPVLPMTIGYIGNRAGGSKRRAFLLSLALVLGMALAYATIGTIFAALGMRFGRIWASGWAVFAIAVFFMLMSLFLLDIFTLPPAGAGILGRLRARAGSRYKGIPGALLVGGVNALIVGPCTGPILAIVLAAAAASLGAAHGAAYALQTAKGGFMLFLFGLGQGALILLCGTFTGLLGHLPKSGAWLGSVKKGFALLVMAGASLLLVYVGQGTDFPMLSNLLGSMEATRPRAPAGAPLSSEARIVPLLDDGSSILDKEAGKRGVVLVFFATWCPHCMAEAPRVERLAEELRGSDVALYGVDCGEELRIVSRFVRERGVSYDILLDSAGKMADRFGVTGIPTIVGIDSGGIARFKWHEIPEDAEELSRALAP